MRALLLASVVAVGWVGVSQAAPTVGDPSFEAVSTGSTGFVYNPTDNGGWTFTSYAGVATNGSGFGFANAPGGTNVGFIQSFHNMGMGSISQLITGLTSGASYVVSFSAAARPAPYSVDPITLTVNGGSLGVFTPTSTAFQTFSTAFTASATTATLAFTGGPSTAFGDLDTAIDLVSVNPASAVPEPTTLALLGLPLGLLGLIAVRRRREFEAF